MKALTTTPVYRPVRDRLLEAIYLPVKVKPMPRPRKGASGKIYQPKLTMTPLINALVNTHITLPDCPLILDAYIHFNTPESTSSPFPISHMHGDEDNLRKAINDALQHSGLIEDDRYIVGGETFKMYGPADYLWLLVYSIGNSIEAFNIDV